MGDDTITKPERVAGPTPEEPFGGVGVGKPTAARPEGFIVTNGWVKTHRKIVEWEWYQDHSVFRVFMHLLLTANHNDKKWQGIVIKAGQKVTSLPHLATETGLSIQSVRTALGKLQSTGELTCESNNRYSLITIQNWKSYQESSRPINSPANSQATTNKKLKKIRSKEVTSTAQSAEDTRTVINLFKDINPSYEILFKRKPQHEAAARLLKREPIERIRNAIAFVAAHRTDRFCPRVSTPIQLEEKWGQLESYGAGLKTNKQKVWI